MTKQNFTSINVVLDRSGSMQTILEPTISGFNTFIAEQKKVIGECEISLHQFDNEYETIYSCQPIAKVLDLTAATFIPRGMTALHDAIGKTINSVGTRLSTMKEEDRPDTVIILIVTDGLENASKEFTSGTIAEMIAHQKDKYSWDFIFLGANQDAVTTGAGFKINANASVSFNASRESVNHLFQSVAHGTSGKRSMKADLYARGASVEEAQVAYSAQQLVSDEDRKKILGQ